MEIEWYIFAAYILGSYLIGGIPMGYLVMKFVAKQDITKIGSGNIGATNVYRVLGWRWAIPVFILDFLKGLIPLLIVKQTVPDIGAYIMVTTLLGNIFSPYLKFKGGKGVATTMGILSAYFPIQILSALVVGLLTIKITKLVSLTSLSVGLITFGLLFYQHECWDTRIALICLFGLIVYAHRTNIKRLIKKEEQPIQRIKKKTK
jgi:glycerol-3-phosphate acyltransferase PlsY